MEPFGPHGASAWDACGAKLFLHMVGQFDQSPVEALTAALCQHFGHVSATQPSPHRSHRWRHRRTHQSRPKISSGGKLESLQIFAVICGLHGVELSMAQRN